MSVLSGVWVASRNRKLDGVLVSEPPQPPTIVCKALEVIASQYQP